MHPLLASYMHHTHRRLAPTLLLLFLALLSGISRVSVRVRIEVVEVVERVGSESVVPPLRAAFSSSCFTALLILILLLLL
jgi:hypothetical protein